VSYRAQRCGQTQEWLTERGTPPVNTLAWLGLAWLSYRRQREGHFQLLRRGTYDTIKRNGASLNYHFPLPTKKRVTAERLGWLIALVPTN